MSDDYIECPCCGCEGAYPGKDGLYYDGQPLVCGCPGAVRVDEDGPADEDCGVWVKNGNEPCQRCGR